MRTTIKQNVIYEYRYINLKDEFKCHLRDQLFSRRDYTAPEEEEYTTRDRIMILSGIVGGAAFLYCLLSYLV